MKWIELTDLRQLDEAMQNSLAKPVLIFKHSTTCSTSRMALDRLERKWNSAEVDEMPAYFLNIQANRNISNAIAEKFGVRHESPQAIVLKNAQAVYDESHFAINYDEIRNLVIPPAIDRALN